MFHIRNMKFIIAEVLVLASVVSWVTESDCLIITSVIAGDKKFKTISFDSKFLKPLMFESDMPLTEFRRHRNFKPPKFDIDVNIPIKLPLEEEYPKEELKRPVTSDFFFQTKDIVEPPTKYGKDYGNTYADRSSAYQPDLAYASSNKHSTKSSKILARATPASSSQLKPAIPQAVNPFQTQTLVTSNARADVVESSINERRAVHTNQQLERKQYDENYKPYQPDKKYQQQEFIPGGFVNLQLSGPNGGPKMTYEDHDREKWAQQLSQIPAAMPYPILNYQQLQNFYGGLGTFTNGLPDYRYAPVGVLDQIKSSLSHITDKFSRKRTSLPQKLR